MVYIGQDGEKNKIDKAQSVQGSETILFDNGRNISSYICQNSEMTAPKNKS